MFFLQIKKAAIGTILAPSNANATMIYHDIQVVFIIRNIYNLLKILVRAWNLILNKINRFLYLLLFVRDDNKFQITYSYLLSNYQLFIISPKSQGI